MKTKGLACGFAAAVAMTFLNGMPSMAQDAGVAAAPASPEEQSILQEVVVTSARRRNESVQQTPVSVTALDGPLLERAQIETTADLGKMAPSLQTFQNLGSADVAGIFLRGFGAVNSDDPATDPPVAVYIDGLYQPHVTGTMMDLFDVDKVEVLRGPQGTLFGKNAPSGAISITTKRPTGEWGGQVQVDAGSFDRTEVRARLDAPIIHDVLSAKFVYIEEKGGNYKRNLTLGTRVGGQDIKAGRAGFLFTPAANFDWYVSASHSENTSPQQSTRDQTSTATDPLFLPSVPLLCSVYGHCNPSLNPPYTTRAGLGNNQDIKVTDVTSEMNLRLSPVTLTAVTGYSNYNNTNYEDVDSEPEEVLEAHGQNLKYHDFSQELRVGSVEGGGWDFGRNLDWVAGAYYFKEGYRYNRPLVVTGINILQLQNGNSESKALFVHANHKFSDQWSISAGTRKTWDSKDHTYNLFPSLDLNAESDKWSNLSSEAGVQYTIDRDKMVYFRYAEGYRGGGFTGNPSSAEAAGAYNPETARSFEIGAKFDWLDKRLRTNLSVYRSYYKDLQRSETKQVPVSPFFVITTLNAAKAQVQGVELETIAAPIEPLTLKLNIAYLDAHYTSFFGDTLGTGVPRDNTDFLFPYSPKWSGTAVAAYVFHTPFGAATISTDYTYRTKELAGDISAPINIVPSLGLLGASIRFQSPSDKYSVTVYGRNLTNKFYEDNVSLNPAFEFIVNDAPPRNWGATVSAKF